jgi:hypothetical protein
MPATRSSSERRIAHRHDHGIARVSILTELVDELLRADERRVGGGVECVTAVIELLAPDQLLGARRGVGVDRIERASVVARGGVRRHANRIETGAARARAPPLPLVPPPSIEQPATTIAATCRARCASRTPDRGHERSPRGHRRSARRPPPVDDEAYSTQTQQTARSNRTVCWLLDRRRRTRAGTRDRRRRDRITNKKKKKKKKNRKKSLLIGKQNFEKTLPFRQFGHSTSHSPFDCASDRSVSRLIVIRCSRLKIQ